MVDIRTLKKMNIPERYAITKHAKTRLHERGITLDDIINCVKNGKIIEQYENDKPLPSCLVLGMSLVNKYLHAVLSHDDEFVYLITAYYPDTSYWLENLTTRRK